MIVVIFIEEFFCISWCIFYSRILNSSNSNDIMMLLGIIWNKNRMFPSLPCFTRVILMEYSIKKIGHQSLLSSSAFEGISMLIMLYSACVFYLKGWTWTYFTRFYLSLSLQLYHDVFSSEVFKLHDQLKCRTK